MNIVYIEGDSTTFGMNDLERGGWPNRLHIATLNEAPNLEDATLVFNRAMPGRTLPGILREAEANMAYYRRLGSVAAVLQTGMNEVKIFPGSRAPLVSPQRFGEQVLKFCDTARQNDCYPILVGPPPIDTSHNSPTFSGSLIKDELLAEYSGIMSGIANQIGNPFVNTRATFAGTGRPIHELLDEEGYHPNALGHALLATEVYNVLPFRNP